MITEKKTQFLVDELDQLRQQGLFRPLRVLGSAQDTEVVVDGKHVLNLSSNNYLGLTTHPRLKAAMIVSITISPEPSQSSCSPRSRPAEPQRSSGAFQFSFQFSAKVFQRLQ